MAKKYLKNAHIVNEFEEFSGGVVIENGKIVDMARKDLGNEFAEVIDLFRGHHLFLHQ